MVRINGELTPIPYEPLTREMSDTETMDEAVLALVRDGIVAPKDAIAHLSSKDMLPALELMAPSAPPAPPAPPRAQAA